MKLKRRVKKPTKLTKIVLVRFRTSQDRRYAYKVPDNFPKLNYGDKALVLVRGRVDLVSIIAINPSEEDRKLADKFLLRFVNKNELIDIEKELMS